MKEIMRNTPNPSVGAPASWTAARDVAGSKLAGKAASTPGAASRFLKSCRYSMLCVALVLTGISLRAATFQVQIRDFYFTPTNLSIAVGDTVRWTNTSSFQHDTSGTNAAFPWSSGTLNAGATYSLTFTNAGTFRYLCNRHFFAIMNPRREQTGTVSVASANLPPSVNLTNPVNNAKFHAPASLTLEVTASDPGGSVTNVEFFSGTTPLGNDTTAPYSFPANNLAAGNYTFTARAQADGGLSATSAVVNVAVLTNAVLTLPERLPDGQFRLTILGIGGQTYATESSTNLANWSAFATNVAPANSFNVTDATAPNILQRFYRARQDL